MKKIKVDIKSNSYEVIVGSDLVNQENLKRLKGKEVLLVADEKVPSEYKNSIIEVLSDLSSKKLAPKLLVNIKIECLKSTVLPLPSVNLPSSKT